mmetsp:Transcript_21697/g.60609  ORF Transcript_21697/g.60609 Transcript_21697/m.60609 type:complete len:270 (+) Transcript_21697:995-1804(+)
MILHVKPVRAARSTAASASEGGVTIFADPLTSSRANMTPLATACAFSSSAVLPGGNAPSISNESGPSTALSFSGVFVPRKRLSAWRASRIPSASACTWTPSTQAIPAVPPFISFIAVAAAAPTRRQSGSFPCGPRPTTTIRFTSFPNTRMVLASPSPALKSSSSTNSRTTRPSSVSTSSTARPSSSGPSAPSARPRKNSTSVEPRHASGRTETSSAVGPASALNKIEGFTEAAEVAAQRLPARSMRRPREYLQAPRANARPQRCRASGA